MKLLAAAALFLCCASSGLACEPAVLDETPGAFVDAIVARLRPLGVRGAEPIRPWQGGAQYAVVGARFTMFLDRRDGLLSEIGIALSGPATEVETRKQAIAASFAISHIAHAAEEPVEERIRQSIARHTTPGSWVEREGKAAVAVFTRTGEGLVVRIGRCKE